MTGGPLDGVRVLEMGNFIAGPFAGQLLADYGAEVIKIEPPAVGDTMRHWGITRDGASLWWPTIARNKRSVTLDLRQPTGQELLRRLAAGADLVVENFRPGTLARWGLDYAALRAVNERLILVHVSGFGQSGPQSDEPGFGNVGEAVGGVRFTTGAPDRPPSRSGISLGDSLASLFAVIGALAALQERSRSGVGQEVDVAIYESVLALMESTLADFDVAGVVRRRTGSVLPGVAPSNSYPTADGVDVIIAGNGDGVFRRLAAAMGQPDLAADPRFADHRSRGEHADVLDRIVTEWSSQRPVSDVLRILRAAEVPVGIIHTAETMFDDEHFRAREMIVRMPTPQGWSVPMAGVVPKFSRTPGRIDWTGPELGADTETVLRKLADVADAELTALRAGRTV